MLKGALILVAATAAGEGLARGLSLPLPGPVVGMVLLAAALLLRPAWRTVGLERAAGALLGVMGCLFVPAGVGLVDATALLRAAPVPILAALVGSTLASAVASAVVMKLVMRRAARAEVLP